LTNPELSAKISLLFDPEANYLLFVALYFVSCKNEIISPVARDDAGFENGVI
jgi:hypothetical protein